MAIAVVAKSLPELGKWRSPPLHTPSYPVCDLIHCFWVKCNKKKKFSLQILVILRFKVCYHWLMTIRTPQPRLRQTNGPGKVKNSWLQRVTSLQLHPSLKGSQLARSVTTVNIFLMSSWSQWLVSHTDEYKTRFIFSSRSPLESRRKINPGMSYCVTYKSLLSECASPLGPCDIWLLS